MDMMSGTDLIRYFIVDSGGSCCSFGNVLVYFLLSKIL